ncbi:MAG TPA: aldo/keto reductase [Planctomycetota bacterium]|nr:aldo/keto reductase [Planctomycetota bacterium]
MTRKRRHANKPSKNGALTRREFLAGAGISTLAAAITAGRRSRAGEAPPRGQIEYRTLGRTGERVSMVGLGGWHLGIQQDENDSIHIIRHAVDNGINFLDNCWDYNEGKSEERMGKALRDGYRKRVFLMTKIDGQTRQSAEAQLHESLRRLQTDMIDLVQIHEAIRMSDPEKVFAPGGSVEALIAAQKAGKIRFIGFTGHKSPDIHLKMLEFAAKNNFRFDAVQLPLNVMDAHFDSFEKKVLPVLVRDEIGVLGMKPLGNPHILRSNTASAVECLHYAMNLPTSVVITGCDSMAILEQALNAARTFKPLDAATVAALFEKTRVAAQRGEFEKYKTTGIFDGTNQHPEWLG